MKTTLANGATGATIRAALNAMFAELYGAWTSYVAGRWYSFSNFGTYQAGAAVAANSIRLVPVLIRDAVTISDLAAHVTTLSAGGNFQLAIYASDAATLLPTGSPLAATGNLSTAATGAISGDITGADVSLAPGLYWGALIQDNAVAVYKALGVATAAMGALIGSTTLASLTTGSTSTLTHLSFAHAFGTWPDLTAASFVDGTTVAYAAIWFKVSAVS